MKSLHSTSFWYLILQLFTSHAFPAGLDKVYNRGDLKDGGAIFKVTPTVIKDKPILQHCFQINGTKEDPIMPQSVLPDLSGFKVNVFFLLFPL